MNKLLDLTYENKFSVLQSVVSSFCELTKTNTFFLSTDHNLINRNEFIEDEILINQYLTNLASVNSIVFPTVVNNELTGFFFMAENQNSSTDHLLIRGYLESTYQFFLTKNDPDARISILNPLPKESLFGYLDKALLLSSDKPLKVVANNPLPSITGDIPTKEAHSDIYRSITWVLDFIDNNISQPLSLEEVAKNVFLSPSYLSRIFKKNFKINFINYINTCKIALAQQKLVTDDVPINKLAQEVGFSQASHFTKTFKQKTGITPSEYRKQNTGIQQIYTITRNLSWLDCSSAFEVSEKYFRDHGIQFESRDLNGFPYIYSIDGLNDIGTKGGWIYTIDCVQPSQPSNHIKVTDKCVIQWIYTENTY